jgi:hypothetical protein
LADGSLDTVSLLAFASDADSGDVFVVTWYDQSLSNNATQSTGANQPKIVSGGSLVLENGKPAIEFDGVNDDLRVDVIPDAPQPFTLFNVRRYRSNSTYVSIGTDSTTASGYADINIGNQFRSFYGSYLGTFSQNTNRGLWYSLANGVSSQAALDGSTAVIGDAGAKDIRHITVGSAFGAFYAPVNEQEVIIYPSNKSANKAAIETNINTFYSIY